MTALAYTQATCECGNPTILEGIRCADCALNAARELLEQVRYDGQQSTDRYELFESIRSACSKFPHRNGLLRRVSHHICRTITCNSNCDDPLPRLEQLRADLWELAP